MDLLKPARRVDAQIVLALISLAAMAAYFANYWGHASGIRDAFGYVVGRDFVNTWMGARAVLSGTVHDILHVDTHIARMEAVLGAQPPHNWSYPPTLFLFIWPLGYLSYMVGYGVWSAAGIAGYLGAAASWNRSPRFLLFVAATPAIAINLFSGQTGFVTATLLVLILRYLDDRPLLAGALLGLMVCKPHLVMLFPIALALSGRWRVFVAAGLSVVALIALTAVVFGSSIWGEYFRLVVPVQRGVLDFGTGFLSMMPTGFMHARILGLPLALAWKIQAPFTLFAIAAVIWTFLKRRDRDLSIAVLLTASVIGTPYAFNYDMVVFGWLAAILWPRLERLGDKLLLVVVWTLPLTMVWLGDHGIPLAAPVLALFLARLLILLRADKAAPARVQLP